MEACYGLRGVETLRYLVDEVMYLMVLLAILLRSWENFIDGSTSQVHPNEDVTLLMASWYNESPTLGHRTIKPT